jgi:hypothetical protein
MANLTNPRTRRPCRATTALALALLCVAGCSHKSTGPRASLPPRTFRMGFSGVPPRQDLALLIDNINLWSLRADAAIMSDEVPWDSLLAGRPADSFVVRNQLPLAQYYRSKGLRIVVMIDPANGLDRAGESTPLVNAGRSITEPAIQRLYRNYAVAMDTILRPDHLGLALETNLIRAVAPASIYSAVRQMANDAAADIRAVDATTQLLVSIQVDVAWGRLVSGGSYVGIAQDLTDFPFIQAVGLSSYPYLAGFAQPEDLPLDYYSRIVQGTALPVIITEGGWASQTVSSTVTTPAMQRRYIVREAQLVDQVTTLGWFQLTFTDLDMTVWPPGVAPFAYNGLVDTNLDAKAALAPWDSLFMRPKV